MGSLTTEQAMVTIELRTYLTMVSTGTGTDLTNGIINNREELGSYLTMEARGIGTELTMKTFTTEEKIVTTESGT